MLDYWRVMCFTGYWLNRNPWIWIPFPIDSDCTLLYAQVDRTRYSSIASGNNCIFLVGSVDLPHVLVACSFASVGFFGNNESSSSLKQSNQPYYKQHHIYHTGIHSKIVRLTSHEWWSIYGWFMTTFQAACDLLLKISHYTNCATGRSHASMVWLQKKSRICLQIQTLIFLLTIKLTQG
jgi:hypothetical protein